MNIDEYRQTGKKRNKYNARKCEIDGHDLFSLLEEAEFHRESLGKDGKRIGNRSGNKGTLLNQKVDITGQVFGYLTALHYVGRQPVGKKRGVYKTLWAFRCRCGNEIIRLLPHVKSGYVTSCGCKRRIDGVHNQLEEGQSSLNGLYGGRRRAAILRDIEWNLSIDEFRALTKNNCHYCGLPPSQKHLANKFSNGSYIYNGLDRVDNEKGYLLDNVVACCWLCNRAKSVLGVEEFLEWVHRIGVFQIGMREGMNAT